MNIGQNFFQNFICMGMHHGKVKALKKILIFFLIQLSFNKKKILLDLDRNVDLIYHEGLPLFMVVGYVYSDIVHVSVTNTLSSFVVKTSSGIEGCIPTQSFTFLKVV